MSTVPARLLSFTATTVGKKVVMAATGIILFGFLVGHVAGNLQIFAGAEKINAYSKFLHETPSLLWGARGVLLVALVAHIASVVSLYRLRAEARPVPYAKKRHRGATLPAIAMLASGVAVVGFIVFHLAHFTTGHATFALKGGEFIDLDPYHNMLNAFRLGWVALLYIVAMWLVGMHLAHGLWSMTQSLGFSHPRWTARIRPLAGAVAFCLALAFAIIPIAVALGFGGK